MKASLPIPLTSDEFTMCLTESAREIGVTLTPEQVDLFRVYLRELQKWNAAINLVGRDDDRWVIQQHFADSLSCVRSGCIGESLRLLDIGTGAGFPSLPLKIYAPTLQVTAVDAVGKKIAFVQHLCRVVCLPDVTATAARIEHLRQPTTGVTAIGVFDVIVSRAVGEIAALLELAAPFLAPDGCVILQRGHQAQAEMTQQTDRIRQTGLRLVEAVELRYSFCRAPRYLTLFCKNKA